MTLDNAVDTLIAVAPHLTDLLDRLHDNKEFKNIIDKREKMSNAVLILRLVPVLLTPENRNDFYFVLAAISGKTVSEIGSCELKEITHLVAEAMKDEDLRLFMVSLAGNIYEAGE